MSTTDLLVLMVGFFVLLCLPSVALLGLDYFLYQTLDMRVCLLALLLLLTSLLVIGMLFI